MGKKTAIRKDVAKPPSGRPTLYNPEVHDAQVNRLCLLGLNDEQIAGVMQISVPTLHAWKKQYPEFLKAVLEGKEDADGKVARALYERALGYSHPDVDIRVVDGALVETPIIRQYPPDPQALRMWLHNRQPKLFRERTHTEISGVDGGPIELADATNYAALRDKIKARVAS